MAIPSRSECGIWSYHVHSHCHMALLAFKMLFQAFLQLQEPLLYHWLFPPLHGEAQLGLFCCSKICF